MITGSGTDDEGFPIASEQNAGTLYRDEFEVVWVCVYEDHAEVQDWVWRSIGKSGG